MSASKGISLSLNNITLLRSLDEREVANSILGNANNLKALEAKTHSALDSASSAVRKLKEAKFETSVGGLFTEGRKNFKTIMNCQSTAVDGIVALSEAMSISLEHQKTFAESLDALFFLGCESIAENRKISQSLEMALSDMRSDFYGESDRERIISVIRQLKDRQDVHFKIEGILRDNRNIFDFLDELKENNDARMAALEKYISAASDSFSRRITVLEERSSQPQVHGQSGRSGYIFAYVFGVIGMAMGAAALFLHH